VLFLLWFLRRVEVVLRIVIVIIIRTLGSWSWSGSWGGLTTSHHYAGASATRERRDRDDPSDALALFGRRPGARTRRGGRLSLRDGVSPRVV